MVHDAISPVLTGIVDAAKALLSPVPRRIVHVNPGEVAWDGCCDGQLWGRIVAVDPHVSAQAATVACGVDYWLVTVAVGVIRCVETVDDRGNSPRPARVEADGRQQALDLAAIERAVLCDDRVHTVNGWTPLGPEGGCAGGEWEFVLRFSTCGCEA